MARAIKIISSIILISLLATAILRGVGIFQGDPLIPIIVMVLMFIAGYVNNLLQLMSQDIILRYNKDIKKQQQQVAAWLNWN